jgi:hypothetical protein
MDFIISVIMSACLLALAYYACRAGVFQNAGLTDEADQLQNGARPNGPPFWIFHLYSNNHTPTPSDVLGAYTECVFSGYAPVTPGPTTTGPISGNSIPLTYPVAIFTQTASPVNDLCYGYYITDPAGNLVGAELLAGGPFSFNAIGKSLQLTVTETLTRV